MVNFCCKNITYWKFTGQKQNKTRSKKKNPFANQDSFNTIHYIVAAFILFSKLFYFDTHLVIKQLYDKVSVYT